MGSVLVLIEPNRFTNPSFIDRCGFFNYKYRRQRDALVSFVENREVVNESRKRKVFSCDCWYDYYKKEFRVATIYWDEKTKHSSYTVEQVIKDYQEDCKKLCW